LFSKFNLLDINTVEYSGQSLLTENAHIDDPSFFWWLQSCSWVKASSIFKDFINTFESLKISENGTFTLLQGQFAAASAAYAYMLEKGRYKDGQSPKIDRAITIYNDIVGD